MSAPGRTPDVTAEEAFGVFDRTDDPGAPLTASDVADALSCSRQTADRTLEELSTRGRVKSREIEDAGRVWWRPAAIVETATDSGPTGHDGGENGADAEPFTAFIRAVEDYAIFTLDPEGRVASWNEGAQQIKGYDEDEILGEHFSTFYTRTDREGGIPNRNLEEAAEQGRLEDEGWRVRADGSEFWANVVITAIRDEDGTLRGFTKVTRDMSERRERTEALKQERELLDQILEASPIGISALTPDGEIIRLNDRAAEIVGTDPEEVADGAYRGPEWDVYDADGEPIPPEDRAFRRVIETGEPVTGFESQVERSDGSRVWLSVNGVPVFDASGGLSLVVLTYQDLTDRKEQECQLRRERDQTEELLKTVPVAITVRDEEGDIILTNREIRETLDLSDREILDGPHKDGWRVHDVTGEQLAPADLPSARVYETGEPVVDEVIGVERPSGERLWFSVNAAPVVGPDSEIERVITAGEDITRLKTQAEWLARRHDELEAELEEIYRRIDDAFCAVDDQFRFTYLNERAEQLLRRDKQSLLGESVWEAFPEARETPVWENFHQALERQEPTSYEFYYEPLGFWVEATVYPSESGLSVYFRDVTERVERQRELEQYETVIETVTDGVYAVDEQYRFTMINDAYVEMTGYSREELIGSHISTVVDDDAVAIGEERRESLLAGESTTGRVQLQIETAAGAPLTVETRYALLPTENEFRGTVGVVRDITERVEWERTLERYQTIVETVNDGVYTVDTDGRFTMVNRAYAEMTGYPAEQLLGEHVSKVVDEETVETAKDFEAELVAGERESVKYEADVLTADGGSIRAEATFALLPHDSDDYERVGVVRDVTERVERERELAEQRERYRSLVEAAPIAIGIIDAEGRILFVNDAAADLVGADGADELIGDRGADIVHPDNQAAVRERVRRVIDDGECVPPKETRIVTHDGAIAHVIAKSVPITHDGAPAAQVVLTDITEQKAQEHELQTRVRQQQVVTELGQRALENPPLDELFDETVEAVADTLDNDFCKVLERQPGAEELFLRSGVGWDDGYVGEATVGTGRDSQAGCTLRSQSPVVVRDLRTEERFSGPALLTDHDVVSGISTIIGSVDDPWGVIGTHDRVEKSFTKHDVNFIRSVATILTTAINRKAHERELRRYETLIEESTDVNAVVDSEGTIEYITPSVEYVLGYEPHELVGEDAFDYIHPMDQEATLEEFVALRDDVEGRSTVEFRFRHADDSWVWFEARGRNLEDDPTIGNTVVYTRDVTDRKQYEERLRETVEKLEASNERLEQFAYVASHDLQEPLRMISNYLGLLEDRYRDDLDEDATEFIDFAVDGADRMREMIDDLLAYSRVDTRAEPPTPTDSEAVVGRVLDQLQLQIEETNADITVGTLPTVHADENQLEQLIQNLVSNAIKYRGDDRPVIEIGAKRRDDRWLFRVVDDGIGIDRKHKDRIFEVFNRLHTREEYPGTGIGLALCKRIVERQGGRIWVESEPGEGSTFFFTLSATEGHHD